jgi:hypothetical protein
LASDGPFLSPEVGRLTSGGRRVRAGRRTFFVVLAAAVEGAAGISLRRQPGSDTTQDFAKSFGLQAPLIVGVRHAQQHEDIAWKSTGPRRREIFGGVA